MQNSSLRFIVILLTLLLFACEDSEEQWITEHGYGPITEELQFDEIDADFAYEGKQIFDTYCAACHSMNSQISGPALRQAVENRTPEFVINYTLNPRENSEKHPNGQELSEQYSAMMFDTGINKEEAIAIYEYMRYYNEFREEPEYSE